MTKSGRDSKGQKKVGETGLVEHVEESEKPQGKSVRRINRKNSAGSFEGRAKY